MSAQNPFTWFLNRAREYRHPDAALRARLACAIFAFCAGLALLLAGVWGGSDTDGRLGADLLLPEHPAAQ
jgi:hypothetical protein